MRQKIALLLLLLITGCSTDYYKYRDYMTVPSRDKDSRYSKTVYMAYSGDIRPVDEVGIVIKDNAIQILAVDDKKLSQLKFYTGKKKGSVRYQLHLLPGEHVLRLGYYSSSGNTTLRSRSDIVKTIHVEKEQIIYLSSSTFSPAKNVWAWNVEEKDGSKVKEDLIADFDELLKLNVQEPPQ